jgi:hypothetical protein
MAARTASTTTARPPLATISTGGLEMLRRMLVVSLSLFAAAGAAFAQNNVHTGARVIIPDGLMLTDSANVGGDRWYATVVEGGHSYAIEVFNITDGLTNNHATVSLYENDGVTNFLAANTGACNTNNQAAPSLEGSNGQSDGVRCLVIPALNNATPNRILKIHILDAGGVSACSNCLHRIRVRETTVLSRWTVNGYNMYVAVHNPSIVPLTGTVLYYGDSPAGPMDYVAADNFSLVGLGSVQFVHSNLTLNPNHGSVHVLVYATGIYGGVDTSVQTYAFNTAANNYLFFVPDRLNHGGANTVNYNQ